jgi:hypothetical protein
MLTPVGVRVLCGGLQQHRPGSRSAPRGNWQVGVGILLGACPSRFFAHSGSPATWLPRASSNSQPDQVAKSSAPRIDFRPMQSSRRDWYNITLASYSITSASYSNRHCSVPSSDDEAFVVRSNCASLSSLGWFVAQARRQASPLGVAHFQIIDSDSPVWMRSVHANAQHCCNLMPGNELCHLSKNTSCFHTRTGDRVSEEHTANPSRTLRVASNRGQLKDAAPLVSGYQFRNTVLIAL